MNSTMAIDTLAFPGWTRIYTRLLANWGLALADAMAVIETEPRTEAPPAPMTRISCERE